MRLARRTVVFVVLVTFLLIQAVEITPAHGESFAATPSGQTAPLGVRFADWVIKTWPEPQTMTKKGWEYTNGIILHGISEVYARTGNPKYLDYIKRFVDFYVDAEGRVNLGNNHNVDLIQPSNLLFLLYEKTGEKKYRLALDNARKLFESFPKNAEGGFWHKTRNPNEMWVDGVYMAEPFLVRYGRTFSREPFCYDTAVFQATLCAKHTQNPETGLPVHAWDEDRNAAWADPTTGKSPEVWSRGTGWYAMALVDILRYLPKGHPGYGELRTILRKLASGLKATQDPKTGLWYQVMDKGDRPDNWHETTGSGMFVYALKVAVDQGHIDKSYLEVARKGWAGLQSRVRYEADGSPILTDSVDAMGVQKDYANYVNKPRLENSPHGLCAILLAASQMEKYPKPK